MNIKLSSEFAIAVILIIAGTFAYIFWKGTVGAPVGNEYVPKISIRNENKNSTKENGENWKIFRNSLDKYEFSLPGNWSLKEARGQFSTIDEKEEIGIIIMQNSKQYSVEKLLKENMEAEIGADVKIMDGIDGISIEKKENGVLVRTAKIIQENDVVILTYINKSGESSELFDSILATFKSLD